MREEFEAKVEASNYMGTYGWIEDVFIEPSNGKNFEDLMKKFIGKKVKITIQALGECDEDI